MLRIKNKLGLWVFLVSIFCTINTDLSGQLGQTWSSYYETGFAFNPALTAYWDNIEITGSHRQEWTQFDGAPRNSSVGIQVPVLVKGPAKTSSAVGAIIDKDDVGPLSSYGVKLTYAYRLVPKFAKKNLDQLKIGISLNTRQSNFNASEVIAFDGLSNNAINFDEEARPGFSGSIGIFYISANVDREYTTHYFGGLSLVNLLPTSSPIEGLGRLTQGTYSTAHFGFRYVPKRQKFYVEPSLFASYSFDNELLLMLNTRIEFYDKLYLAVGGDTNGSFFGQAGFIIAFTDKSKGLKANSSYNDLSDLRIGLKVGNRFGPISQFVGNSYEFLIAYNFALRKI